MGTISNRTFNQGESAGHRVGNEIDINDTSGRKTAKGKGPQQQKECPVHQQKFKAVAQVIGVIDLRRLGTSPFTQWRFEPQQDQQRQRGDY